MLKAQLAITVLMALCSVYATAADRVKAIVNAEVILQSEFDNALQTANLELGKLGQPIPSDINQIILRELALRSLQLQMVKQANYKVSKAELNQALANIAKNQNLDNVEALKTQLESAKQGSFAQLQQDVEHSLAIDALKEHMVGQRIKISESQINEFLNDPKSASLFAMRYQLASILVKPNNMSKLELASPLAQRARDQLAKQTTLDAMTLNTLQNKNARVLQSPPLWLTSNDLPPLLMAQVSILAIGETSQPIATPDGYYAFKLLAKENPNEVIVEEYQTRHILVLEKKGLPAQSAKQIEDIYQQLQKGSDFATLAKSHSKDPGSAARGGDLGWVGKGQMVREFETQMLATSVGDFSRPFKTQYGWHILQVSSKRLNDVSEQSKKDKAYQVLYQNQKQLALEDWLGELYRNAYIKVF